MLKGRTCLVTGAGRGIGKAFAEEMARQGASVAVHGRRERGPAEFGEGTSLTATATELSSTYGVPTIRIQADLSDGDEVDRAVREVLTAFGRIDILIHNAGGDIAAGGGKADPNDAVMISEADWRAIMDNNLSSTILVCQCVAKSMLAAQRDAEASATDAESSGRIITVSSDASFQANEHGSQAIYATAKAAVNHYTKCLAQQLRHHNINVNCISPGSIASGRVATHTKQGLYGEGAQKRLSARGTLDRFGSVEEVASVATFLAGPLGDYVAGEVIKVNGGSARL